MSVSRQSPESSGDSPSHLSPERNTGPIETTTSPSGLDSGKEDSYLREATPDDLARFPRVADKVPAIVWLVAFIGAAQRFAYYGTTVPWRKIDPAISFR